MTTGEFISELQNRGLLSGKAAAELQTRLAEGDAKISIESVLKLLVRREKITKDQADELQALSLRSLSVPLGDEKPIPLSEWSDEELPSDRLVDLESSVDARLEKNRRERKKRGSEWESPLMLLGGGGVLLLVVVGALLYYLLFRENADAVLKQAGDYFDSGSYTQAEKQYERFVEQFPNHADHSLGVVRLGMTKLWKSTKSGDYVDALKVAEQVIPEIEDEPAFATDGGDNEGLSQAKRELSSLLTEIAQGLAQQADNEQDEAIIQQRVDEIGRALALTANTKYVPERYRQNTQLDQVRETLDRVNSRRARSADLAATLAEMDAALERGDVAAAYAARKTLLREYPLIAGDASLDEKVRAAAAAEQELIRYTPEERAAATSEAESPVVAEILLADRLLAKGDAGGPPAVVQVDGAIYGIRSGDGEPLWRRPVGLWAPAPAAMPNGDWLAIDARRGELLRLDSASGKLKWRLALEQELAKPLLAGNRVFVGGASGKLYAVDADTGQLLGSFDLHQPLRTAPSSNEGGNRLFVVGEHSNVYTFDAEALRCLGVYHLGHEAGAVAAPPEFVGGRLVVAQNLGPATSRLHFLELDDRRVVAGELSVERLDGTIATPLSSEGRRVAVVTSTGAAGVYELSAGEGGAVTLARREPADGERPMDRFALWHDNRLWIADRELSQLRLLPTENRLALQGLERSFRGDEFDGPMQVVGETLISIRRGAGRAGAIVAGLNMDAGRTLWETEVAVPPAGAPAVDAATPLLSVANVNGSAFTLDRQAMSRRIDATPARLVRATAKQAALVDVAADLGGGALAFGGVGAEELYVLRPNDGGGAVNAILLPGPLSGAPMAWRGGVVAGVDLGQIGLYDPQSGQPLAAPFQPELTPGRTYRWLTPTVWHNGASSSDGQPLLAVCDRTNRVYLLDLEAGDTPHLAARQSADVGPAAISAPLAAVGDRLFAVNEARELLCFTGPNLEQSVAMKFDSPVAWGPHALGDQLLLATADGQLLAIGGNGEVIWRRDSPAEDGQPAGTPLRDGASVLLLDPAGAVLQLDLASGETIARLEVDFPLMAGPVPFASRLVVAAVDGTVLVLNQP